MFVHEAASASDDDLHREARAHLAKSPHLQVVAELLGKLRAQDLPWWTPESLRSTWSAKARMRWYSERPDLRQKITSDLTGLPPFTSRVKTPDFQAELLDAVLDNGDIGAGQFDHAFNPSDMVVYGPAEHMWTAFRERMPWSEESPVHQRLVAWLLRTLLSDRSSMEAMPRKPILTPWEVRAAIDPMVWQTRIPADVRAAVDDARLRQERSRARETFTTRQELLICTPDHIAASVPLVDLEGVIAAAERNMGFGAPMATDAMSPEAVSMPSGPTSVRSGMDACTPLSVVGGERPSSSFLRSSRVVSKAG
jgi:hypothetical protein